MGAKSHADSSWLIALFDPDDAHHGKALRELDELTVAPAISSFVLAELLVSFETSDAVSVNAALNAITGALSTIYDLTKDVAISAAEIRSNNKITLGDAIIIATAIEDKANLLTFDKNMKAVYERIK